ncbi:MAG TPA: hypothetical protein VGJ60_10825 [Chloroflexota bacterium]
MAVSVPAAVAGAVEVVGVAAEDEAAGAAADAVPVVAVPLVEAGAAAAAVVVLVDVDIVVVATDAAVTPVGVATAVTAVALEVATGSATGPVNSGGTVWRPKAPWVSSATSSTGTSPTAGTSHHQRQAGAVTPRLDRTACVEGRGWGGL